MRKLILTLVIIGSGVSFAMAAPTMYIEGPDQRGDGWQEPASGVDMESRGLFFVDIYAEDMPSFGGFQTTLEFLDGALDVAGSSIWMAYNNIPPNQSNRWSDAQITWNDTFLPAISDLWDEDSPLFGLTSEERVGGDPVNKPITEKTLLMTVGYWYFPGAEGDSGSTFYTIGADALDTVFGDELAKQIPDLNIVTGSVTIGEGVVPEPCTLAVLGIGIAGLAGFGRKRTRKNSA